MAVLEFAKQLTGSSSDRLLKDLKMGIIQMTVSVQTGYGSVKLPSSDLKGSKALSECFAANGVSSTDTIKIIEAPGIDPETGKETILSPAWARNKLTAAVQELQEAYSSGGDLYPADLFPKVNQEIKKIIDRSIVLMEAITQPEVWAAAEENFFTKINNIFDALELESAMERDRIIDTAYSSSDTAEADHLKRLERYDMKRSSMLKKFPSVEDFIKKFRVSNSEPSFKGSLMDKISESGVAIQEIAEVQEAQQSFEFQISVQEARTRAIEDFQLAVKERTEALTGEFFQHIEAVLAGLDKATDRELSDRAKNLLNDHIQRTGAILQLLNGLSQFEPDLTIEAKSEQDANALEVLRSIGEVTAFLKESVDKGGDKNKLGDRLKAFRESLREDLLKIEAGKGSEALAEWCLYDDVSTPVSGSSHSRAVVEVAIDPTPAAAVAEDNSSASIASDLTAYL